MRPTEQQQIAIEAPGNILVVAGAGAGKTGTLVQRCVRLLLHPEKPVDISRVLVVTFTEAAAAEVRDRIRRRLEEAASGDPANLWIQKQMAGLDSANISTLHSFCFSLIREHFYDLDLDPALTVIPPEQAEMLFLITFEELLSEHYLGAHSFSAELKEVLRTHFGGWDKRLLSLTRRTHHFTQTRPNPEGWFEIQFQRLSNVESTEWRQWYAQTVANWCAWWQPYLASLPQDNENAHHCAALLKSACETGDLSVARAVLERRDCWPKNKKTKQIAPFEKLFDEADFLDSLSPAGALDEDWNWFRGPVQTVLRFVQQFTERYSAAKKERGVADFHDLEQNALRLLWNPHTQKPTGVAESWRKRIDAVFVDEYQDINAAQDLIISALSRDGLAGNRFLVGDIKQSIYRFRQADPSIFRRYLGLAEGWTKAVLSDNFRSREGILEFINPLFAWLMQGTIGGIAYDNDAQLRFGGREQRAEMAGVPGKPLPVELNVLICPNGRRYDSEEDDEGDEPEPDNAEKEARLVADRLRALRESKFVIYHQKEKASRPVEWKDMVVLLRAASSKVEVYAKVFEAMGVPLQTKRDGFFTTPEVLDLVNILTILDNPLQDIPLVAVLRSPCVGMTANELALVRTHAPQGKFWNALQQFFEFKKDSSARQKIDQFLRLFHRWRNPRSSASLAQRLEAILADTGYADWLLTQPRGAQRHANIQQLLRVARQFDDTRGESLYLFLRHIEDLQDAAGDIEPAPSSEENAVRLMTVHQSKGLEFPVVAIADLGKRFNTRDQSASVLLHEKYGLCSTIQAPTHPQPYTSLPLWLASREERLETIAEEMRIFYVALTRAENLLLLFGATSENRIKNQWVNAATPRPFAQQLLKLNSSLDWLGAYGTLQWPGCFVEGPNRPEPPFTVHIHHEAPAIPALSSVAQTTWSEEEVKALHQRVSFLYPHAPSVAEAAKATVSALRRRAIEQDEEAVPLEIRFRSLSGASDARERGVAAHTFLQHHDLAGKLDSAALRAQADTLIRKRILTSEQRELIDFDAIAAFWKSEFGLVVRDRLLDLQRELPFTVKLTRADLALLRLDQALAVPEHEFILVQGIADFVVLGPKDILLLDFKTDQITAQELEARATVYRPQLALYSLALERIYGRPVKRAGLYFLSLQQFAWL
jgi:ATP-dependent helicase/nuclease subunit A